MFIREGNLIYYSFNGSDEQLLVAKYNHDNNALSEFECLCREHQDYDALVFQLSMCSLTLATPLQAFEIRAIVDDYTE